MMPADTEQWSHFVRRKRITNPASRFGVTALSSKIGPERTIPRYGGRTQAPMFTPNPALVALPHNVRAEAIWQDGFAAT
jgi:hypothetical protein